MSQSNLLREQMTATRNMADEQSGAREAAVASVNDGWVARAARVTRNVISTGHRNEVGTRN